MEAGEPGSLVSSVSHIPLHSLVIDMDYLVKDDQMHMVLSFLDRCLMTYCFSTACLSALSSDEIMASLIKSMKSPSNLTSTVRSESVTSYARFLIDLEGRVQLFTANTTGDLQKCLAPDRQNRNSQMTSLNRGSLQQAKECISGLAMQEYENDQELLISYFGGGVALYKYNELDAHWQL